MGSLTHLGRASVLATSLFVFAGLADAQPPHQEGPPGAGPDQGAKERAMRMTEFLERMDGNHNGHLEPGEIPDRARPFVERMVHDAGLNPSKPVSLKALRERLRRQFESRGSGPPPSATPEAGPMGFGSEGLSVPGFGQVEDRPPVPGFGDDSPGTARIEKGDLDRAAERFQQYDRNHDGFLDRAEVKDGKWSDEPFQYDKNGDGRLSQQELAMRYAVRRVSEADQQNRPPAPSSRPQSSRGPRPDDHRDQPSIGDRPQGQERHAPTAEEREAWSLAESLIDRYDVNRNKALDRGEWGDLGLKSSTVDANGDGRIDRMELALWLLPRTARSSHAMPEGLPDWFLRRDADGDGQIVMSEFADEWDDETAAEFVGYDRNGDGVILPEECLAASNLPSGAYVNHQLEIIPAGGTIYSEIVVPEEDARRIADLDVQLSITHTRDESLDAFLVGPEGEHVELFTGVGGQEDHFSNTILDDEAPWPIVRAQAPFAGRYRPEAALKEQPSLRQFTGKPIAGTWTLEVRADRSDRPGALHGWSLMAQFEGEGQAPAGVWEDGSPQPNGPQGEFTQGQEERNREEPDDRSRHHPGLEDSRSDHPAPSGPWWLGR